MMAKEINVNFNREKYTLILGHKSLRFLEPDI